MPKHEPSIPLHHMPAHAREAYSLAEGRSRADLEMDRLLKLALVRLLEIIGEAANRVPIGDRSRYSSIPWPQIIGMRNRLIHGYDSVDFDILWQMLSEDLPPLMTALERILASED